MTCRATGDCLGSRGVLLYPAEEEGIKSSKDVECVLID